MEIPPVSPRNPSDELKEILDKFRENALNDDATYSVIAAKLHDSDSQNTNLPDFTLEPTLKRDESGSTLGFRIGRGRTSQHEPATVTFATYDYITIGVVDLTGGLKVDPDLKDLLSACDLEKEAALNVAESWQAYIPLLGTMREQVIFDPVTHTPVLADDSKAYGQIF